MSEGTLAACMRININMAHYRNAEMLLKHRVFYAHKRGRSCPSRRSE